jgi:hypothetical protein
MVAWSGLPTAEQHLAKPALVLQPHVSVWRFEPRHRGRGARRAQSPVIAIVDMVLWILTLPHPQACRRENARP